MTPLKNVSLTKIKEGCMLFWWSKPHYLCSGVFVMRSPFVEIVGLSQWLWGDKTRLSAVFIPMGSCPGGTPYSPFQRGSSRSGLVYLSSSERLCVRDPHITSRWLPITRKKKPLSLQASLRATFPFSSPTPNIRATHCLWKISKRIMFYLIRFYCYYMQSMT